MEAAGPPARRGGEPWVQARTTDRLRCLDELSLEWNAEVVLGALGSERGRRRLLRQLRATYGQVS